MDKTIGLYIALGIMISIILSSLYQIDRAEKAKQNIVATVTPTPQQYIDGRKLWSLIQDWRLKNNLQTYIKDDRLCHFATTRLLEVRTDFSHKGFFQHSKDYFRQYPSTKNMGENLIEQFTAEDALTGWLHSPEHLANLKNDFKYSCLVTDGFYAVQDFAN